MIIVTKLLKNYSNIKNSNIKKCYIDPSTAIIAIKSRNVSIKSTGRIRYQYIVRIGNKSLAKLSLFSRDRKECTRDVSAEIHNWSIAAAFTI